jgi:hypothetical protein
MTEDKKPFTVSDRRHFTAEGAARTEADAESAPAAPATPAPTPARADETQTAGKTEEATVDFASFLLSLGAQAGALLAEAEHEGEKREPSLAAVRSMIAILEMLRDKTEGRRTPDEDAVLDGLLYELRMGYVAVARAGGA